MDFIIILILALSAVLGARKGFALTLASFMQWFVCIVAGLLLCSKMKGFLIDYTTLDNTLNRMILSHIENSIQDSVPYKAMPDLFSSWISRGASEFAYGTSASITDVVMTVLSFLLVVAAIKIIAYLIVHLFSRKYNDGVTGLFDKTMGFIFGLVRGVLLVLLFFTVLVPVLSVLWPGMSETIIGFMDGARFSEMLYDGNMLLVLIRDIFS
ncbi:CvpA family protein [Ihubacter sp. rT4E-8]|uniref:CvpA family protein n=1 Tax=unclassified Ihubacter TaxID=2633299 RepID=UPI003C7C35EA